MHESSAILSILIEADPSATRHSASIRIRIPQAILLVSSKGKYYLNTLEALLRTVLYKYMEASQRVAYPVKSQSY